MPEQIAIWIPNDLNPASQTSVIANYMLANKVIPIDVNTEYHNNFTEFYDKHIRQNEQNEQFDNTFCSKYGTGINVEYLIANANKKTYATVLSLEVDPDDPTQFEVLAILVFKWSPTANAVKIQALCSNQKRPRKGAGAKLLKFLKKTLTDMNINIIYLNPVPTAVTFYKKNQFQNTKNPDKKIHDSSSPKLATPKPKPKSKSLSPGSKAKKKSKAKAKAKSKRIGSQSTTRSLTKSKSKSKSQSTHSSAHTSYTPSPMPTMTINLRAVKNWKKTKTKMRSYSALTRKNHGKSHAKYQINTIYAKIDKIVANLSQNDRDDVCMQDIFTFLQRDGFATDDYESQIRDYVNSKYSIY